MARVRNRSTRKVNRSRKSSRRVNRSRRMNRSRKSSRRVNRSRKSSRRVNRSRKSSRRVNRSRRSSRRVNRSKRMNRNSKILRGGAEEEDAAAAEEREWRIAVDRLSAKYPATKDVLSESNIESIPLEVLNLNDSHRNGTKRSATAIKQTLESNGYNNLWDLLLHKNKWGSIIQDPDVEGSLLEYIKQNWITNQIESPNP